MIESIHLSRKTRRLADAHCFRFDSDRRRSLGLRISMQVQRNELARALGLDDEALIDRLVRAGFDAQTLPALSLAPIALVAWASGTVTHREFRVAIDALFESSLPGRKAAIRRFRQWLKRRPHRELWDLWKEYVTAQLEASPPRQTREEGQHLYEQAERVALASGGLLGIGQICAGERRVLNLIRQAYRLDEQTPPVDRQGSAARSIGEVRSIG